METEKNQYIRDILESVLTMDYIRPDEVPDIDLYMDQVTTFMDRHLESSKRFDDDKLLTKTMINNYTKNELIPSPDKKKYSKNHMFMLIFIYYMKNIMSISDIKSILTPLTDTYFKGEQCVDLFDIYAEIYKVEQQQAKEVTRDILKKLKISEKTFDKVDKTEDEAEFLKIFSFVCMLCFDVYMKTQAIESLIDNHNFFKKEEGGSDAKESGKAGKESGKARKEQENKEPKKDGKEAKKDTKKVNRDSQKENKKQKKDK